MNWNAFYNHVSSYVAANITQYDEEKAKEVMMAAYLAGWLNCCGLRPVGEPHDWNKEKGSLLR